MLYVSRKIGNKYVVVDTEDWIEESYTKEKLREIHKLGLKIKGVTDTGIKVVNWKKEPEYLKAKALHYQLEITKDNRVKIVNKPEDLPIPKFCCQYEYYKDADGLIVMSGEYLGGNLIIPKFVNKLKMTWGRHNKVILSGGSGLVTLEKCFRGCASLEKVYLGNLDVSNVIHMGAMFKGCENLQNIDSLRNWNVSGVKEMHDMFYNCERLQNIDALRDWNVSNVENMKGMFEWCENLQNIDGLNDWDVSTALNKDDMFYATGWKVDRRRNRLVIE